MLTSAEKGEDISSQIFLELAFTYRKKKFEKILKLLSLRER